MNGLDGQITTASSAGSARAAMKSGMRPSRAGALERSSLTTGSHAAMHEILLEIEPAVIGQQPGPHRIVASSARRATRPPCGGTDRRSPADSVSPAFSRRVRSTCRAMSRSPRRNQVSPPRASMRFHERPGLVVPAPAEFAVGQAGQRIGDRIDIGRDRQAEMLEIVAGVDDDQQVLGRHDRAPGRARAWRRRRRRRVR